MFALVGEMVRVDLATQQCFVWYLQILKAENFPAGAFIVCVGLIA